MSLPGVRSPLGNSTNDLHARTLSPAFATAKSTQSKHIRRKVSVRAFHSHVDSSEDLSGEHSSIFEALWVNPSVESFRKKTDAIASGDHSPSPEKGKASDNSLQLHRTFSPSAHLRAIHIPTQLTTITEQKSVATLRPSKSFTLRPKGSLLSHLSKRSSQSLKAEAQARHKHSFSLDDVSLFRHSKSKDMLKTSSDESAPLPYPSESVYPNQPVHSPPHRIPTPPGLPTFNTPAAHQYRLPPPRLRFRDLFSTAPCDAEAQYLRQTVGLPRGVVMRGEAGVLVRGRWRPGQSGHTAGMEGHRFYGAMLEVAEVMERETDRRIPSVGIARARTNPAAPEAQVDETSAHQGVRESVERDGKPSKWVKFWESLCFVCCGVERGEDGQLHPQVIPSRFERVSAGYAGPPSGVEMC